MIPHHASPTALVRAHIHCPITALTFYPWPSSLPSANSKTNNTITNTTTNNTLYLLSGQDTHLHFHTITTTDHHLLASIQIFPAQPIQGISTSPTTGDVLLWGGPYIALLTRERITKLLSQQPHPAASSAVLCESEFILRGTDWIYHASFASPSLAVVVTAHNEVFPLHIITTTTTTRNRSSSSSSSAERLRWGRVRAPPSSRPILYAARLAHLAQGVVLVAAGTVFGEIVVWRCRVNEDGDEDEDSRTEEGDVEVLYVFTGHEGSIFGVDISPEVIVAGKATRLLASCSDDRTIRIWDISDSTSSVWKKKKKKKAESQSPSFPEARETGFGENGVLDLEAQAGCVSSEPISMAMGHVSRIWNARFAPATTLEANVERWTVYSFGEDATAQRWRLDIDGLATRASSNGSTEKGNGVAGLAARLTPEGILHRHSGKHIWSSAIFPATSTDHQTLVATGGSDGKISMAAEIPPEIDTRSVMLEVSGTEIVRRFPDAAAKAADGDPADALLPKATKRKKTNLEEEPFLMYALLSAESAIATTATGRLFSSTLCGAELSWSEVVMPQAVRDDLRKYQIVRSAGTGCALLGSTSGTLYVYRDGAVEQIGKLSGKISDIFTVPTSDLATLGLRVDDAFSSPVLSFIVATMGSSTVTFLVLNLTASGAVLQQEHAIELEAGFIPTSVACCGGCLIFGSRIGALTVYKLTRNEQPMFEKTIRIERPFTRDAVSSIIPLPPKEDSPVPYFLTTSRDGRYRIYEISTSPSIQLHLRHEAVPPLGPMIESAVFTPSTPSSPPELILAGFRSKHFIVWNETRQLELASVECGGAFRSFTHRIGVGVDSSSSSSSSSHDPITNVAFIWTRASRTCVYSQTALLHRVLKPGGHGREIKAVAASEAAAALLATGAEDTTVRIWSTQEEDAKDIDVVSSSSSDGCWRCLAVIDKHTAGIQCLQWASANYLVSSSGNEELYIWRVTRLDKSAYEGLAAVCEGVYPDKTRDSDLRILSFDVEVVALHGGVGHDEEEEEVLCLSLVLSNSTLRTYRYSKKDGFALLAEGRYTGACLMQIRHLRVAEAGREVHVLTAATDGHLALWKMSAAAALVGHEAAKPAVYELVEVVRLHQSGIKSLDIKSLSQDRHVLVTGGDDNALGYMSLAWSDGQRCFFTAAGSLSLANGAHAAAITGLCITGVEASPDEQTGGTTVMVCTASNDQRVKAWRIVLGGDGRRARAVKLVQDGYSAIADCGDLEMLNNGRHAVVVGVGMEVWELPSK